MLAETQLPVARYRFTARMASDVRMPEYAGSLLRGQFGSALRRVACMTGQPSCSGCPLQLTCPYTRIFEAVPPTGHDLQKFSQIPNAYVMEPPQLDDTRLQEGDQFQFSLVLVGNALDQLALVIFAMQRALVQGLTRSRSRAELLAVEWVGSNSAQATTVWTAEHPVIAQHINLLPLPECPTDLQQITLRFYTPLRLQNQGSPLRAHQLNPHVLIAALARRGALVLEFHAGQKQFGEVARNVAHLSNNLDGTHQMRWFDWTRYSSRQQQEMTLGGLLGEWTLCGPEESLSEIWPWLWLGQWLHVGKNATMGMGGYTLVS